MKLAFDASQHLDHITFTLHGGRFDVLKAQLDARLDAEPSAGMDALTADDLPMGSEMRICEMDDGDVVVTFERVSAEA